MSLPSRMMRPSVGFRTPVRRLITVVLPAPFGPISAWRAPFSIASERSWVATMPPKRFSRPTVSRIGMISASVRRSTADCRGTRHEAGAKANDGGAHQAGPFLDTLAADENDHHQHKADPELPILRREACNPVLQKFVDHGADQAAVEIAGAADNENEEQIGRAFEGEHVKRTERRRLRQQRAGNAGQSGGKRIDRDHAALDRNAD